MALPAAIRLTIALHLDGEPVPGFPLERRPTGATLERFDFVRLADGIGTFTAEPLPVTTLPLESFFLTTADPIRLSINDQPQDGVFDTGLRAGAAVLLVAATITQLATTNATTTPAALTLLTLTP